MNHRSILMTALVVLILQGHAHGDERQLEDGLYEVRFRLELPHLEQHAIDRKATVCVDQGRLATAELPVPLLSQNDMFSACRIGDVRKEASGFSYDIICAGRGAGRAIATYETAPGAFKSRIAITQGGKNMTMTEVQHGRRLGDCDPPM